MLIIHRCQNTLNLKLPLHPLLPVYIFICSLSRATFLFQIRTQMWLYLVLQLLSAHVHQNTKPGRIYLKLLQCFNRVSSQDVVSQSAIFPSLTPTVLINQIKTATNKTEWWEKEVYEMRQWKSGYHGNKMWPVVFHLTLKHCQFYQYCCLIIEIIE